MRSAALPDESALYPPGSRQTVVVPLPRYAVWELTLACNLKCSFCGSRAGRARPDELNTEDCLRVVNELADMGILEVTLIGGEAYLRKDWLQIIEAVVRAGMQCSIQSGARALNRKRIEQAVEAGLRGLGVSIDGDPTLHDRLRGVPGAYYGALSAMRHASDLGLAVTVNTQIGRGTVETFDTILADIAEARAIAWRLSAMVPMGRAADNPQQMIEPYELPDVFERIYTLYGEASLLGVELRIGNSLGYFGPYETELRSGAFDKQWSGCYAGREIIGIESDGTVKGCPSLPTSEYSAGNVTRDEMSTIWEGSDAIAFTRGKGIRTDGFCGSCYYAPVCRAGCSWMAHSVSGHPGDNPFCHHRALSLSRQGMRERLRRIDEPAGTPFDTAEFEVVLEDLSGCVRPGPAFDDTVRPAGVDIASPLLPCPLCRCHVFDGSIACPHCGTDIDRAREERERKLHLFKAAAAELAEALRSAGRPAGYEPIFEQLDCTSPSAE